MPEINRRKFILGGAGAGAAVLLTAVNGCSALPFHHASPENTLAEGSGVLVIVTLYGGNDGLSTVIPYTDNAYHDARPELAYAPQDVLPLDGQLGLNPGLKGMSEFWNEQHLAIIRGVSYPQPDRSHFRSMDIWQTASPSEPVPTGWIGRWLDATGDDPLRAVNIGAVLPTMALGEKQTASSLLSDSSPVTGQVADTLSDLGKVDPNDPPSIAAVCSAYRATRTFGQAVVPILGSGPPTQVIDPNAGGLSFTPGSAEQPNPLSAQLNVAAKCIKGGLRTRVYMVALGGFDTHADERKPQQRLLQMVDDAVTPFLRDMSADKYGKNVVVMVYSEFGRRVAANASQGTDHGTAGPVLIAGAPVKGGFYGDQPSLTDLTDGDLKGTTDFRDIYHELLSRIIGTDPTPSVGTARRDLGFL